MTYGQCQEYLRAILVSGIKFGLRNVRTVLSALGTPHRKFPAVLVGGTNGKGSVCAMLTKILSLHGFRVGLYTSPHLIRVEERIRINDELIPRRDFCRLLAQLKCAIEELIKIGKLASPLTYFEILTCLAFLHFEQERVDIAVLEVGMGGRLDATNVVRPRISVITTVSRDHQEFLGRTLGRIATEKAGIVKRGVPVVCGLAGKGAAYGVIRAKAEEIGAPFLGVFDEKDAYKALKKSHDDLFSLHWHGRTYRYSPGLQGEHQGRNAAVAIVTALELSTQWKRLHAETIVRGIKETRWEGRLEAVSRRPQVVLDGAHNEEGAAAVSAYARDSMSRPLTLVFGTMKDKDINRVTRCLFPVARTIILTSFPYHRAASPEKIFAEAPIQRKRIFLETDPQKAVDRALELTPVQGAILVTGSLFLVGEVKKHFPQWSKMMGTPAG
jgi:dihydrofolate synthase/folylpolyglutamate synthase